MHCRRSVYVVAAALSLAGRLLSEPIAVSWGFGACFGVTTSGRLMIPERLARVNILSNTFAKFPKVKICVGCAFVLVSE